ncbi:MAG: hypothetical protein KF802_01795 [Bdellovibrionaceae bacterium]|nr:hypothetical protein [Pseudobdellovibrionaceae bacterium]
MSITADLFKMPETIELSSITTAGHYILSSHLVRSLTKINKVGDIEGDLAASWTINDGQLDYKFILKDSKFSNGEPISADDIVESIKRQIKMKTAVHFNFERIKDVKALSGNEIQISLKSRDVNFLFDLSKPEFGVLHRNDRMLGKNLLKFSISSGPFSLEKKEDSIYYLKANEYFVGYPRAPKKICLQGRDGQSQLKDLLSGKIDFMLPFDGISLDQHKKVLSSSEFTAFKPHIGFSYWISLNPRSDLFKSLDERSSFQKFVFSWDNKFVDGIFYEKATQLYLPDGDGRPTAKELDQIWKKILSEKSKRNFKNKRKLRVLPLKFSNSMIDSLLNSLRDLYKVEIISYSSEDELVSLLKANQFDIKISNNDFSSIDLAENLKTTFNSSRPYVFLEEADPIRKFMDDLEEESSSSERSSIYKKISISLLERGLIAPLVHQRVWFYHKKELDISAWATSFPEISFWKTVVNGSQNQ